MRSVVKSAKILVGKAGKTVDVSVDVSVVQWVDVSVEPLVA